MSYLFNCYAKFYDSFMKLFKLDDLDAILGLLSDECGQNICDVGGGTGILADILIERGNQVTIIDPSIPMTNIAKQRNKKVEIVSQRIQQTDFFMEFDFILFKDTFHHLPNQKEVLLKCHQMLKKGGQIIIQDFSPKNIQTKTLFLFEACCFEKIYPISDKRLIKMIENIGYQGTTVRLSKRDYIVIGDKESHE